MSFLLSTLHGSFWRSATCYSWLKGTKLLILQHTMWLVMIWTGFSELEHSMQYFFFLFRFVHFFYFLFSQLWWAVTFKKYFFIMLTCLEVGWVLCSMQKKGAKGRGQFFAIWQPWTFLRREKRPSISTLSSFFFCTNNGMGMVLIVLFFLLSFFFSLCLEKRPKIQYRFPDRKCVWSGVDILWKRTIKFNSKCSEQVQIQGQRTTNVF